MLVALVGQNCDEEHVLRSQAMYLNHAKLRVAWSSVACVDDRRAVGIDDAPRAAAHGPLRINTVARIKIHDNVGRPDAGNFSSCLMNETNPYRKQDFHERCFLRRLTACRDTVMRECAHVGCTKVFLIRCDLWIASKVSTPFDKLIERTDHTSVYARYRCVGAGERRRTRQWPAPLCYRDHSGGEGCAAGHLTLDDQVALMPAALAGAVFRKDFPPPPSPNATKACAATVAWPEGVLTHALFAGGTPVRELPAFASVPTRPALRNGPDRRRSPVTGLPVDVDFAPAGDDERRGEMPTGLTLPLTRESERVKAHVAALEAHAAVLAKRNAHLEKQLAAAARHGGVDAAEDAVFASVQVASLSHSAVEMPPTTTHVILEIGCSDRDTVDDELHRDPSGFLISFEPLLDKYAVLLARGTERYHGATRDRAVPLGHHHQRAVILPIAVTEQGGPVNFSVSAVAGCSSVLEMNAQTDWGTFCKQRLETRVVPSITLADALALAGGVRVQWLKMDAQGVDSRLLRATPVELLRARVAQISLEAVADNCETLYRGQEKCQAVVTYMHSIGYRLTRGEVYQVGRLTAEEAASCDSARWRRGSTHLNAGCEADLYFAIQAAPAP